MHRPLLHRDPTMKSAKPCDPTRLNLRCWRPGWTLTRHTRGWQVFAVWILNFVLIVLDCRGFSCRWRCVIPPSFHSTQIPEVNGNISLPHSGQNSSHFGRRRTPLNFTFDDIRREYSFYWCRARAIWLDQSIVCFQATCLQVNEANCSNTLTDDSEEAYI